MNTIRFMFDGCNIGPERTPIDVSYLLMIIVALYSSGVSTGTSITISDT